MKTPPTNPTEIQLFLNSCRGKYGLSQEKLALLFNATQEQICKWERGTHAPSLLRMREIKRKWARYDKRNYKNLG